MSQSGFYASGGGGGTPLTSLTGNVGGVVSSALGNINIDGVGVINTVGNPPSHTVFIELLNGTNGQLLIGGGVDAAWASLTSSDGSITFTPGPNSLDLVAVGGGGGGVTSITGDIGTAQTGVLYLTGGSSGAVFDSTTSAITQSFNYLNLPDTDTLGNGIISFINIPYFSNYPGYATSADNLFIGANSGNTTLTVGFSYYNVGIGNSVFSAITSGATRNVAVGYQACSSMPTGDENVAVGYQALEDLNGGQSNVAIGSTALASLTTGNGNIAIGQSAGGSYTGAESDNIILYDGGGALDNGVIRIGTQSVQSSCYIAGIKGVTTANTEIVTIDSSTGQLGSTPAILTNTGQPAFSVFLSSAQTGVTGGGTVYRIPFDLYTLNQGGYYDVSTHIFTAPVTGFYQFNCAIILTSATTGTTLQLVVDNLTHAYTYNGIYQNPINNTAAGNFLGVNMSIAIPVTAGDQITFTVEVSGGTNTVGLYGLPFPDGAGLTYASGYLIC